MVIKTNIPSVNTNRVMKFHQQEVATNLRNLSSGMRINRAGDDASGMAVSEKMSAQIMGLNRAELNTYDGVSFLQTAEGYVTQTSTILKRLRELSVQAANGIYTTEDRMQIEVEISQLVAEVDRIASAAQFNGLNLLTGRYANPEAGGLPTASMWFHVGANMDQNIRAYIGTFTAAALGLRGADDRISISVSTPTKANQLIGILDEGLKTLNKQIADIGGYQNRLDYVAQSLAIGSENLQAARSRIRDVNMAQEVSEMMKNQILSQSQVAMLAQANQQPQNILQLLQ